MVHLVSVQGYSQPNQILLQRRELAAYIAAIAAEWTMVEHGLASLMAGSFGNSEQTENGLIIERDWVAEAAIRESETIRVRLKIADATLGGILADTPYAARWLDLKKVLKARAEERNRIVHGTWALADLYPKDLLLITLEAVKGEPLKRREVTTLYTVRDLHEMLDRFTSARIECHEFLHVILDAARTGVMRLRKGTDRT